MLLALAFSLRSKPKAVDLKDGIGLGNGQSGGSFARVVRPIVISRNADASVGESSPVSNVEGQEGDVPNPAPPRGNGIKKRTEEIKIGQSTLDRIASGGKTTRELLRREKEKPKTGRPKAYVYQYRDPGKKFNAKLNFSKARVNRSELISAVEAVLSNLKKAID